MSGNSLRTLVIRTTALLVGLLVLMLSVVSSVLAARNKQIASQDAQLTVVVDQQVNALGSYFERSRAIDSLLANSPVFADFYRAPGSIAGKIRAGGSLMTGVNAALRYLEQLYPATIGEACFIDQSGTEIARVVNGVPASPEQLSADEANNPFFAPTFALPPGQVYQAQAYKSPDTNNQVISNSTVVSAAGGRGMVHFEIALDSFRMSTKNDGATAAIVDAVTGQTLVDSRDAATTQAGGMTFAGLVRAGRSSGITTLGEQRLAYRRLPATAGNANVWYVVVSAPRFGQGWAHGLGVGSLALLTAALLTILLAGASWRSHQRSIRHATLHDALTGLPNRTWLLENLQRAIHTNERDGSSAAVLLLDLDRFKEINDMFGEHYGDLLLSEVARRLAGVSGAATATRLGGDQFAVLLPSFTDISEVSRLAEQLLGAVRDSFVVADVTLDIEASLGVTLTPEHGRTPEELLRRAEVAVCTAKDRQSGHEQYDPAANQHAPNRLALLGDLRHALDTDDQILVHYQPKIDTNGRGLVGVEALVRWQHPQRGLIAPDAFIPVAETTALIQTLTTRVLTCAIAQARAWLAEGLHIPVAVNLSARCLTDLTLPGRVLRLLADHGLPVALLHLEITESAVMADPQRALDVLQAFHDAGIQLSLDDFGTGHSSMSYLRRLPVGEIKIDKSFVTEMVTNESDEILVRSIIDLAHNLGLSVVAEGVEDEPVLLLLRELGATSSRAITSADPSPRWPSTFGKLRPAPARSRENSPNPPDQPPPLPAEASYAAATPNRVQWHRSRV